MLVTTATGYGINHRIQPEKQINKRWWSATCNFENGSNKKIKDVQPCPIGDENQPASFLLWGDSYARVSAEGVSLAASQQNIGGVLMYSLACPPLLGITRGSETDTCELAKQTILDYVYKHPELKTIILAGRWALWAEGSYYSFTDEVKHFNIVDFQSKGTQDESFPAVFERGLERTVETLLQQDREVVIISQIPEIGYNVSSADFIAQRTRRDTNDIIGLPWAYFLERNKNVLPTLDKISTNYNIQIVNPSEILCNESSCLPVQDGQALYTDDNHLSVFGSEYISSIYDPIFQDLKK